MLLDNWVLKLASLTVAFILWFVVIVEEDPVEDKTFYNIKVNLVNTKQLEEMGRVYEVLDGTDTLRSVTVEAPRSILQKLEDGDIIAEADLDNMSGINTVEIEFSCPGYSRDIISFEGNISNVKLSIEDKMSKSVDIKYNIVGEVTEGYMIGSVTLGQNRLQLEGPESKVSQVARAVVDVDVAGSSGVISTLVDVYLVDSDGNALDFPSVSQSVKNVGIQVEVLTIKEIPVEYIPVGEPAEGYLVTGVVEGIPETVRIAGKSAVLNNMNVITVSDELDITGATETLVKTIDLEDYLNPGIGFADSGFDGIANVTVYIEEEKEKSLRLRRENLQVLNAPEGFLAEVVIDQEIPLLHVKGLEADIEPLRESTLIGTIDVGAWMEENRIETVTEGIQSIPVEIPLTEGQNAVNEVSVQILFTALEEEIAE